MFQMQQVGKRIVELRKLKNMTQVGLADQLGVSYQAVSNWERGNSMPDISKLPELAEIFGVSVDDLLGEKSALVESAVKDDLGEYLENNEITSKDVEKIGEMLPILKPSQVDEILEKVDISKNVDNINAFLPFMCEEDVKEFALEAAKRGEPVSTFMPFMREEDVKEFALEAVKRGEPVSNFLPFMWAEDVNELALEAAKRGEPVSGFLPMMNEEDVYALAQMALEKGESISGFLPFMREEDVKQIALSYLRQKEKK